MRSSDREAGSNESEFGAHELAMPGSSGPSPSVPAIFFAGDPVPLERPALHRFFNVPRPDLASAALRQLFSAWAPGDIVPEEIQEIERRYGIRAEAGHSLRRQLWMDALDRLRSDAGLSPSESRYLKALQEALGLDDDAVDDERIKAAAPQFRAALTRVLADNRITDDERAELAQLASDLAIPPESAAAAVERTAANLLVREWNAATAGGRLDEMAAQRLLDLSQALGVPLPGKRWALARAVVEEAATKRKRDKEERAQRERDRAIAASILDGYEEELSRSLRALKSQPKLASLGAAIQLGAGERCHCAQYSAWYELLPDGNDRFAPHTLQLIDGGTLYVTSKRLVFEGGRRRAAIHLDDVFGAHSYTDAVRLQRHSDRDAYFVFDGPAALAPVIHVLCRLKRWSDVGHDRGRLLHLQRQ